MIKPILDLHQNTVNSQNRNAFWIKQNHALNFDSA